MKRVILLLIFVQLGVPLLVCAGDVKPEDIVARHLASLGTPEARKSINSRLVQGKLGFTILVGGGGTVQGSWGMVSQQDKSNFVMRFGIGNYRGEQFVFDGNKTYIAFETASQTRSRFGDFVHSQDYIIKEGLLGGELLTGWALENLDKNYPKLTYEGTKKVDGHQVYDVQYHSRHASDMQIHLYFDPDSGRHVKTLYFMTFSPNMGRRITDSVNQQEIRYTIEERFSDFKNTNGLILPSTYSIEFTQETQSGRTNVYHWDMTIDQVSDNVGLDPKNFDTK